MRETAFEGKFYPADREEGREMLKKFFSSLDQNFEKKDYKAGIVPHAGWVFSGRCASFLYNQLRRTGIECFIILGTNHSGTGSKITFSVDDFETFLGNLPVDMEVTEDIIVQLKKAGLDCGADESVHKYEHSIEVQTPFLKAVSKEAKIVPMLIRDLNPIEVEKFGKILSNIIKSSGRKIFILASSDMTHYGKGYGFVPFTDNVKDNLYKLDENIINKIISLDVIGFLGEARKSTVCGKEAIAVCMSASKNLGLKAEKLCYCTSGDVLGKWDNVVGYASIGFYNIPGVS